MYTPNYLVASLLISILLTMQSGVKLGGIALCILLLVPVLLNVMERGKY